MAFVFREISEFAEKYKRTKPAEGGPLHFLLLDNLTKTIKTEPTKEITKNLSSYYSFTLQK